MQTSLSLRASVVSATNRRVVVVCSLVGSARAVVHASGASLAIALSFPEPQHRWMQVEASFPRPSVQAPLELRMSRSSPGRYSLHDFAKNVYDVHAFDADGRELATTRPDPYGWNVAGHGGSVTVKYKVLRRSRRRHLSRRRHDPRAHQHAGRDHVGARPRRSAGRPSRSSSRPACAGRSRRSCIPERRRSSSPRRTCST